jgi:hypothetical protein
MVSDRALPMNVTTKKSESDPNQRIRQLEVAIEHALAAAMSARMDGVASDAVSSGLVEISYPGFEFRETLKRLQPKAGLDGIWVVIELGSEATMDMCRAACTVLQHYYPDESFVVSQVAIPLAS